MSKKLQIRFILVVSLLICCIHQLIAQPEFIKTHIKKQIDSMVNLLPKLKEDSTKAETLTRIANSKMGYAKTTGNWDDPIEWAHKALKLATKVNFKFGLGRCNWILGMCWMYKGNYSEAIKFHTAALEASFKNGRKILTGISYRQIGDCYIRLGNYQKALKNFQSGFETAVQMKSEGFDDQGLVELLSMDISDVNVKLHNYTEALNFYKKALTTHEYVSEEEIRIRMASVQMEMNNYNDALKNLLIALQIFHERLPNAKSETDFAEQFGNGMFGKLYMQIGEAYCKIGSIKRGAESISAYNEAINYLNKSLLPLKVGGSKEDLMNSYDLLRQACEAINDYQNALHFTTLYNGLKDSLYNKTTYLKLADQQVKYETEKAAVELKGQQERERIQQDALRDKMLADQKLEEEKKLADEKINHERSMAEEKIKAEKSMAVEKSKQEKLRAEKQQANNLLLMGLIFFVMISVFLILYLRQRHEKKRAVEKAETIHQMAELELQSLRSQLNPHFMFNSLNSIQTLIMKEQTDKSQSYLSRFARLLRMLLDNADKPFVSLRKEIELLQLYLSLESLRVPDMQYSISTDPVLDTEQILIPNMILQPYVENAIWHGLSHKETDKQLQIRIFKENGTINYEIEDNGVGRKKAGELKSLFRKQHQSKGMELLSKRIDLLNKEYSSVIQTEVADVIKNKEVAGTLVSIKVPLTLSHISQTNS